MIRKDWNDQIFRTEKEKQDAIISKVKALNSKGQPLLIFTSSVDKSEIYSDLFRKNNRFLFFFQVGVSSVFLPKSPPRKVHAARSISAHVASARCTVHRGACVWGTFDDGPCAVRPDGTRTPEMRTVERAPCELGQV